MDCHWIILDSSPTTQSHLRRQTQQSLAFINNLMFSFITVQVKQNPCGMVQQIEDVFTGDFDESTWVSVCHQTCLAIVRSFPGVVSLSTTLVYTKCRVYFEMSFLENRNCGAASVEWIFFSEEAPSFDNSQWLGHAIFNMMECMTHII